MRGMRQMTMGAVLALFLGAAGAVAQAPPDLAAKMAPFMIRPELLKSVSPHVQVIPDESRLVVPNVGFVIGSKGVLVVDTGMGPKNGEIVAAVAKQLAGRKAIWLVTTHIHPEHDLGAQAFPASIRLIRSQEEVAEIADQGLKLVKVFSANNAGMAELLKDAAFRKADVTFDRDYVLDLGGVKARIVAMGANHTAGDTIVWVEKDRLLFSGDLAMARQPMLMTSHARLAHWHESLATMEKLSPAIIVPSHGPMGGIELIQGYQKYFAEIAQRAAAAKAGGADETAAVSAVASGMSERYPDRGRLEGAAKTAYGEAK